MRNLTKTLTSDMSGPPKPVQEDKSLSAKRAFTFVLRNYTAHLCYKRIHHFLIKLFHFTKAVYDFLLVSCAQKPRLRRLSARSKQDSFLKDMMCVRYIIKYMIRYTHCTLLYNTYFEYLRTEWRLEPCFVFYLWGIGPYLPASTCGQGTTSYKHLGTRSL